MRGYKIYVRGFANDPFSDPPEGEYDGVLYASYEEAREVGAEAFRDPSIDFVTIKEVEA